MSYTRPGDVIYAAHVPATPAAAQFGCTDCLMQESTEAVQAPLYLFAGTYLCGKHVTQRGAS